jgi:hypothetical protein
MNVPTKKKTEAKKAGTKPSAKTPVEPLDEQSVWVQNLRAQGMSDKQIRDMGPPPSGGLQVRHRHPAGEESGAGSTTPGRTGDSNPPAANPNTPATPAAATTTTRNNP